MLSKRSVAGGEEGLLVKGGGLEEQRLRDLPKLSFPQPTKGLLGEA